MAASWGIDIRWARGERGWIEIRDPTDGRVYQVWARDCPRYWVQYATVRAKLERERRDAPGGQPERRPVYAF